MSYVAKLLPMSLLTLLACQDPLSREKPKPTAHAQTSAKASTGPSAHTPPPPLPRLPLADRLASEAVARPARAVRAQALVKELSSRGVEVPPVRQVLASPIGASYCESSVSANGFVLAVCEFESADKARLGAKQSRALFDALVPNRVLVENGNALLTLAGNRNERTRHEAQLAREAFLALAPTKVGS